MSSKGTKRHPVCPSCFKETTTHKVHGRSSVREQDVRVLTPMCKQPQCFMGVKDAPRYTSGNKCSHADVHSPQWVRGNKVIVQER